MSQFYLETPGGGTPVVQFDCPDGGNTVPDASGLITLTEGAGIDITCSVANQINFAFDITEVPTIADTYTADSGSAAPSANNLNVVGGEGIDTSGATDTITIAGEDATDTNKGIASFVAADFSVSSGAVSLVDTVVKSVATDSGAVTPASHSFTIAGGTGVDTSGSGSTVTIVFDITEVGTIADTYTADTGSAQPSANNLNIVGGEGIDTSGATDTITIAGEDASDTNKGIASFVAADFSVSSGAVSLVDTVVKSVSSDSGSATPSSHTFTIAGGTGIDTSGSGSTITVAIDTATVGQTITGDSGGALSPTAGNWNILGTGETDTSGSGSTLSIKSPRVVHHIVDATAADGTHTTIASALTAASSGEEIWIRPGTYTEDLTLKAGVDLVGLDGGHSNGHVQIIGKMTGDAGTCTLANLRFQTNSDVIYDDSATAVTNQTVFQNCWFVIEDGDCITLNNSGANQRFECCQFRQSGSNFDLYNITLCGNITFYRCDLTKSGATTGTANIAAGTARFRYSRLQPHKFTTSSTGIIHAEYSQFISNTENETVITTAGSGSDNFFHQCHFESGTATAISIGTGTTVELIGPTIRSSNANPVSGAGTLIYSGIDFRNTGNGINTTTQTPRYTQQGKFRARGQPAFLARPNGTKSNVTGNGTVYTVVWDDEVFDQDSNFDGTSTFTAPVDGKYQFSAGAHLSGAAITGDYKLRLVTSNHTYMLYEVDPNHVDNTGNLSASSSILVDMDASDTATVTVAVGTGSKTTDVVDDGNGGSFFSGILLS